MLGFDPHDHGACKATAVAKAQAHCEANGLQFTPVRKRVLELLLNEHRALGAYEILELLRADGFAAQPPVAYRALDFLVKHGFAHKIEKLSAFVACAVPGDTHTPAFLICTSCDTVAEACSPAASGVLQSSAKDAGFKIEKAVMEAEGLCPNCQDEAPQ